jgi:hypothetical protein
MNATIVRLLPTDEQALLQCYVEGTSEPSGVDAIYEALEVPTEATPSRLAIAVAQILLHEVQGTLPKWAASLGGRVILNRKAHTAPRRCSAFLQPTTNLHHQLGAVRTGL